MSLDTIHQLKRVAAALEEIAKHTRYLTSPQVLTNPQELSLADWAALTTPAAPSDHCHTVHATSVHGGHTQHTNPALGPHHYTMRDAEREQRDRAVGFDKGYQDQIDALKRDLAGKDEIIEDLNDELNHQKASSSKALKRLAEISRKNVNELLAQVKDQREQNAEARQVAKNYAKTAEAAQKDINILMGELQAMLDIVAGRIVTEYQNTQYHQALVALQKIKERDDGGI